MEPSRPSLGRRLLAGVIDLYTVGYVALLPVVLAAAVFFLLEERTVRRGIAQARAMPKGVWKEDPKREAALQRQRARMFKKLYKDLSKNLYRYLNSLAPRLDEDQKFKSQLDKLIRDPYTELVTDTVRRGIKALERHGKTPEGKKAERRLARFLGKEAVRRIFAHIRDELDYRIGQIADYLGFQGFGERIRKMMRDTGKKKMRVPEALHWTNFVDKVIDKQVPILPETRANLGLLRYAAWLAAALALLYLLLRDLLGAGRSAGKRWARLRVVDARTGAPARAGQLVVRGLLGTVLLPLEALLALFDARLGDRVAGTRVIAEPEP